MRRALPLTSSFRKETFKFVVENEHAGWCKSAESAKSPQILRNGFELYGNPVALCSIWRRRCNFGLFPPRWWTTCQMSALHPGNNKAKQLANLTVESVSWIGTWLQGADMLISLRRFVTSPPSNLSFIAEMTGIWIVKYLCGLSEWLVIRRSLRFGLRFKCTDVKAKQFKAVYFDHMFHSWYKNYT